MCVKFQVSSSNSFRDVRGSHTYTSGTACPSRKIFEISKKCEGSYVCVTRRQGSSKSNRSVRSDRGPSAGPPVSAKLLDRHPSLRFSVKKQSSSGVAATSGGSRNDDVHGSADPYTLLTTLQQQARSSSFKTRSSPSHDLTATVGLSPRGSADQLAKVLLGTTGRRCYVPLRSKLY